MLKVELHMREVWIEIRIELEIQELEFGSTPEMNYLVGARRFN